MHTYAHTYTHTHSHTHTLTHTYAHSPHTHSASRYGYVDCPDQAAANAVVKLNKKELDGRWLLFDHARSSMCTHSYSYTHSLTHSHPHALAFLCG